MSVLPLYLSYLSPVKAQKNRLLRTLRGVDDGTHIVIVLLQEGIPQANPPPYHTTAYKSVGQLLCTRAVFCCMRTSRRWSHARPPAGRARCFVHIAWVASLNVVVRLSSLPVACAPHQQYTTIHPLTWLDLCCSVNRSVNLSMNSSVNRSVNRIKQNMRNRHKEWQEPTLKYHHNAFKATNKGFTQLPSI